MNILEYLQKEANRISLEYWANDSCPPKFIISLLYGKDTQKIVITCLHCEDAKTVILFPLKDIYSYNDLEEVMLGVYNSTI